MTLKCRNCGQFFDEEDLTVMYEDPSPAGICLPAGYERYSFCPCCGSDDYEEFELADRLEVEEGRDAREAIVSYNGRSFIVPVDDVNQMDIEEGDTSTEAVATCTTLKLIFYVDNNDALQLDWRASKVDRMYAREVMSA